MILSQKSYVLYLPLPDSQSSETLATKSPSPPTFLYAFHFPFYRNQLASIVTPPTNWPGTRSVYVFQSLNFSTNHATTLSFQSDGTYLQISILNVHLTHQFSFIFLFPSVSNSHPAKTTFHSTFSHSAFTFNYLQSLLAKIFPC